MPNDFKTVAREIADGIKSGLYVETLPSIARLSEQFNICQATVTRVLAQLRDWDLVSGEHGRCVRINPKAEGNEFFHKNVVILANLFSVSMPFYEATLEMLSNSMSMMYMSIHLFFSENQVQNCTFTPDCVLAVSNTAQVMLEAVVQRFPDCPVIRFNQVSNHYPYVTSDNRKAGYDAIRHLADDCGHTHIGILATQLKYTKGCFYDRYKGALEYADKHPDIKLSMVEIPELEMENHASFHLMEKLMEDDPEITAVFATCDMLAIGAYSYATEHNLKIPDDLAVIGFDDQGFGKCLNPALSTFSENPLDTAQLLFKLIREALQGKSAKRALYSEPRLVVRGSTSAHAKQHQQ